MTSRRPTRTRAALDASGKLLGWTRFRGQAKEAFTVDGNLITKSDAQGRPLDARKVRYVAKPRPNLPPILEQQVTDEVVRLGVGGLSPANPIVVPRGG
jgi:hypothetical protein